MKNTISMGIIVLITLMLFSKDLYSQSNNTKELKLNTGAMLNFDPEGYGAIYRAYLAPSFRIKKHEFYLGTQMTDKNIGGKFKPLFGGIAGYKFYIFKEPMRVNMFLHYALQYFHNTWESERIWIDSNGGIITRTNKWQSDIITNIFGFGFNVFIDKNNRYSFNSTMGYAPIICRSKSASNLYKDFYWRQVEITLGFSVKIASIKSKPINK
jgi:hypothetical protein